MTSGLVISNETWSEILIGSDVLGVVSCRLYYQIQIQIQIKKLHSSHDQTQDQSLLSLVVHTLKKYAHIQHIYI